jgi:hypothetical protein
VSVAPVSAISAMADEVDVAFHQRDGPSVRGWLAAFTFIAAVVST